MSEGLSARQRAEVAPGAVHLPDWLGAGRQRELLEACRAWAAPPAGLRTVRTRSGVMSVRQLSLGRHWYPSDTPGPSSTGTARRSGRSPAGWGRSGDAFVFGGPARLAYHDVPRTRPGTSPAGLRLDGRVNVTVRASGMG